MIFGLVSVLAALVLIIALNWGRFQEMGGARVLRLALIWAAIITAMVLALKLFGVA